MYHWRNCYCIYWNWLKAPSNEISVWLYGWGCICDFILTPELVCWSTIAKKRVVRGVHGNKRSRDRASKEWRWRIREERGWDLLSRAGSSPKGSVYERIGFGDVQETDSRRRRRRRRNKVGFIERRKSPNLFISDSSISAVWLRVSRLSF